MSKPEKITWQDLVIIFPQMLAITLILFVAICMRILLLPFAVFKQILKNLLLYKH